MLPVAARKALGLEAGESLEVTVDGNRLILTPRSKPAPKARIREDGLTGLPVLAAGDPVLTGAEVEQLLADFP